MIYKVELKTSKYKKILTTPLPMYMYNPGLGRAQNCGRVKPVNGIPTLFSYLFECTEFNHDRGWFPKNTDVVQIL